MENALGKTSFCQYICINPSRCRPMVVSRAKLLCKNGKTSMNLVKPTYLVTNGGRLANRWLPSTQQHSTLVLKQRSHDLVREPTERSRAATAVLPSSQKKPTGSRTPHSRERGAIGRGRPALSAPGQTVTGEDKRGDISRFTNAGDGRPSHARSKSDTPSVPAPGADPATANSRGGGLSSLFHSSLS